MDCFHRPPVLIVSGGSLPDDTHIEMAMISESQKGRFHSVFQFLVDKKDKSQDKDIFSLPITRSNGRSPQRIPLKNVFIRRGVYAKLNNGKTFILKSYPSGEPHDTKITGQKALKGSYKLEKLQLAIRAIKDKRLISNKAILYSNLLFGEKKLVPDPPNTSATKSCRTTISFDCNDRCRMTFPVEIPKQFYCTLKSGYKWLKILIITDDKLSTMYKIDLENGVIENPGYINITNKSIEMSFAIVKQPSFEMINTTTVFHIEIQLLHSESSPSQSSIEYNPECILHKSEEFIEENSSSIEQMYIQETVVRVGQKRTNEQVDMPGLPVCKAPRTSENNQ